MRRFPRPEPKIEEAFSLPWLCQLRSLPSRLKILHANLSVMLVKPLHGALLPLLAFLVLAASFLCYSVFIEPRSYSVTRLELAGAPPNIVFLADLHASSVNKDYIGRIVDEVNRLEPDIVLLSGDFIMKSEDDIQYLGVLSRLKGKKFAVLGNHDYLASIDFSGSQMKLREKALANFTAAGYDVSSLDDGLYNLTVADEVARKLHGAGFRVLKNEYETLDAGGRRVLIVGLDDCWAGKTKPPALPAADYSIYLLHEPECMADWGYDLLLAGHTHGGQVVLPIIGAPQSWTGMYSFSGMLVNESGKYAYVTRGIGSYPMLLGVAEMRFNCAPEIVLINGQAQ
jgi:predicted MPP superfamily phosphohydrolase